MKHKVPEQPPVPIPADLSVPPCHCGSEAHITAASRTVNGNLVAFYGVACAGKHKIPTAFSTPESALRFWSEHLI